MTWWFVDKYIITWFIKRRLGMVTVSDSGIQGGIVIFGQSLQSFLQPYVSAVTFGIDIAAGIIIGISALFGLISFLKILTKGLVR